MRYGKALYWGILLLCVMFLVACSTVPGPTIVQHEYIKQDIPANLLAPCEGYAGIPSTNGELAEAYIKERQGREQCNADKASIQELVGP